MMRQLCRILALLSLILNLGRVAPAQDQANDPIPSNRLVETWRKHGVDPDSPLESRLKEPSVDVYQVVDNFRRPAVNMLLSDESANERLLRNRRQRNPSPMSRLRGPSPRPHRLTDGEREQLKAAVALLPLHYQEVLRWRLRSIMVVDNMVVGGTVLPTDWQNPDTLYDIAISAVVFGQTASEWVTHKEQSVYLATDSLLSVRVDLGDRFDALTYVLIHEATHVVDGCEGISNVEPSPSLIRMSFAPRVVAKPNPFVAGVWKWDGIEPRYAAPILRQAQFYAGEPSISSDQILNVYAALANTPFASLYSTRMSSEDLAEFATLYHWTEVLQQPYRIIIRVEGTEILRYEPMRSDLVRARSGTIRQFLK